MATEFGVTKKTYIIGGSSAFTASDQYRVVKLESQQAREVVFAGNGERGIGTLEQFDDTVGGLCTVCMFAGSSSVKALCGGDIDAGANVGVDANGAIVAAATDDEIVGVAEEAGADGRIITIIPSSGVA